MQFTSSFRFFYLSFSFYQHRLSFNHVSLWSTSNNMSFITNFLDSMYLFTRRYRSSDSTQVFHVTSKSIWRVFNSAFSWKRLESFLESFKANIYLFSIKPVLWTWAMIVLHEHYPSISYYWTILLILDHSYLVGNLTNSKIAETKVLEPLKSWHFCISNIRTC
jgi:hypothetical protein